MFKFYTIMAAPTLLHGSETWTMTANNVKDVRSSEINFLRRERLYNWIESEVKA